MKAHKLFGLSEGKVLKLEKLLYGLEDSGDYWEEKFSTHVTDNGEKDFGMDSTTGDLSLYYKKNNGEEFIGKVGLYVNDSMGTGNKEFEEFSKRAEQKFDS